MNGRDRGRDDDTLDVRSVRGKGRKRGCQQDDKGKSGRYPPIPENALQDSRGSVDRGVDQLPRIVGFKLRGSSVEELSFLFLKCRSYVEGGCSMEDRVNGFDDFVKGASLSI